MIYLKGKVPYLKIGTIYVDLKEIDSKQTLIFYNPFARKVVKI